MLVMRIDATKWNQVSWADWRAHARCVGTAQFQNTWYVYEDPTEPVVYVAGEGQSQASCWADFYLDNARRCGLKISYLFFHAPFAG